MLGTVNGTPEKSAVTWQAMADVVPRATAAVAGTVLSVRTPWAISLPKAAIVHRRTRTTTILWANVPTAGDSFPSSAMGN